LFLKVDHFLAENSSPPPDITNYYLPPTYLPLSTNFSNQDILANILDLFNY